MAGSVSLSAAGRREGPGVCPEPVRRPAMLQDWDTLTFLHWRYPPAVVERLLPAGLEVDCFEGKAWVSLVPFRLRVAPPGGWPIPYLTIFPETNVRTYVRGSNGPGIWFLSLDASRLIPLLAARAIYHLPYAWARMSVRRAGDEIRYVSRRIWPRHPEAGSALTVRIGRPIAEPAVSGLDHFLTARWRLYAMSPDGLATTRAEHPPWSLQSATLIRLEGNLLEAAGLPAPAGQPIVQYSESIHARLTGLRLCSGSPRSRTLRITR